MRDDDVIVLDYWDSFLLKMPMECIGDGIENLGGGTEAKCQHWINIHPSHCLEVMVVGVYWDKLVCWLDIELGL